MLIAVSERPETCSKCGGKVVEIIYGEPTPEAYEQSLKGEYILGGCCIICGRQFILKY